jgi:hypothetical protein
MHLYALMRQEKKMNKTAAICKLHEIADYRLLGSGDWPAQGDSVAAFFRITRDLGLREDAQGTVGMTRSTPLGVELNVNLMTVFAGCWEFTKIYGILHNYEQIDWSEAEELWRLPKLEYEQRIHSVVYRVYRDFCGHSKWLN